MEYYEIQKQLKSERDKIVKGLEETYRRLVVFKRKKNSPMIIMKEGKVVAVNPYEVPISIIYKCNDPQ